MEIERTQPIVFSEDALPSIFHQTPGQFIYFLERDGNKFLHFYWEQVGKKFAKTDRVDPYGLNHMIRRPQKDVVVAMVIMPLPRIIGEAYHEAFIFRPRRITTIIHITDITTVFILLRDSMDLDSPRTRIIERTKKGLSIDRGSGPSPSIEEFYRGAIDVIKDSSGNI